MFCLFEVPRNFSDSTNPGLYMDSLLKHKKLKRDGGGGGRQEKLEACLLQYTAYLQNAH